MAKPHVVIISPYMANANNGNWQIAWRWSRFLSKSYKVTLAAQWDGKACDVMIALRSEEHTSELQSRG